MQGIPGTPSGTYDFAISNGEAVLEAFSRCQIRPTSLTVMHMEEARRSLNLTLQTFVNKGFNLFRQMQSVIQLVAGEASYLIPKEVISITDAYINSNIETGPGPDWDLPSFDPSRPIVSDDPQIVIISSQDRWLSPRGRADFAMLANKQQPGMPSIYWFNRLGPPHASSLTLWPPPSQGYPDIALTYFALRQAQDANLQNRETPDVPTRFLDTLCADLALRLARKYAPALIGARGAGGLRDDADEAWALAAGEDTEKAEVFIRPRIGAYWRV